MNKQAFLKALEDRLDGLSAQERARALEFYAQSVDDRVEDGMAEEQAVAALGEVDQIARELLADQPLKVVVRERARREGGAAGRVLLLILASPLLLVLLACVLSVYASLWAVVVSVWAVVVSLFAAGAAGAVLGVAGGIVIQAANGLCLCGAGLVCVALGLVLLDPARLAVKGLLAPTKAFGRSVKRLIVGGTRT